MNIASVLASALAFHRAGDLDAARLAYRRAMALAPADIEATNGHAACDLAAGSPRGASRLLARAAAVAFNDVRVVVNACLAAAELGAATPVMIRRALALAPVMSTLMDLMGGTGVGGSEDLIWMQRAAGIEPGAGRLLRLGLRLSSDDRSKGRRVLRRAIARFPGEADLLNSFGSLAYEDAAATETWFMRALVCRPLHAAAWSNMALACHDLGRLGAAMRAGRRSLALEPAFADAHANLGNASLEAASPSVASTAHRRALAIEPTRRSFLSNLVMALAYLPGTEAAQARIAAAWWNRRPAVAHPGTRASRGRLRVGYVSSFSLASTRHLGLGAIAKHDPEAAEVFAYAQSRRGRTADLDLGPALRRRCDISGVDDATAARMIRDDRIDVLVDLAGHTPGNRLGVFAHRPAPVQATWIESFFTTGLKEIDWFLTDDEHSPEGLEQHLTEKPFRIGRPRFCYTPPADAPAVVPPPSLGSGWVRFGCFNYPPKLGDDVIALWVRILAEVPNSRLRLKWWSMTEASAAASMRRRFEAAGLPAERLELAGASPHRDMLAEYGEIDIALDPFPFTGGATTCEALWMGVPVVTLCGRSIIGRQSASLLKSAGAVDLVATDTEHYRQIAVKLAMDGTGRAARRAAQRKAVSLSPLTDADDMARRLEQAFRRMVEMTEEGAKGVAAVAPRGIEKEVK